MPGCRIRGDSRLQCDDDSFDSIPRIQLVWYLCGSCRILRAAERSPMRPITTLAAALLLVTSSATGIQQSPPDRPNVVLIMTDDAGYADLGSYGAPDIRTPNIDSLARDGVKLTDFYANAMSCTPTRAGLISGRYQQRYGVEFVIASPGVPGSDVGLPPLPQSLPRLLKANGYATALIGKWHLGYKPEFSPLRHGFDVFFGYKSAAIDYHSHVTVRPSEGALFAEAQPDLWEGDGLVQQDGYMTDLIT